MKKQKNIIAIVIILIVICVVIGFIFIQKAGLEANKNSKLNVPYYGKIKVGDISIDMYSNTDDLENAGFERALLSTCYKNPNTNDRINIMCYNYEDSEDVNINIYNDLFEKYGLSGYNDICTYVELPKNITFDSTLDDVIEAYGEPNNIYDIERPDGLTISPIDGFTGKFAIYEYENDEDNKITLKLYFGGDEQKLYNINYDITGEV